MGAMEFILHKEWKDMTLRQKIIVGVALPTGFLISVLTIITLMHGISQWAWEEQVQDKTIHLDLSGIPNTSRFVDEEQLNSSNQTLTLAHAPNPASSLQLVGWGLHLSNGSENDYILSGNSITLLIEKEPWDQFHASYRY
ncbi:MAG: hypothetical protein WA137_10695 [Methanothrix sp.]